MCWSDVRICLNQRDSEGLKRVYGRAADAIAPMALADRCPSPPADTAQASGSGYALFVGGAFYANLEAARWFAHHVAPRLTVPTVIVGRGMEQLEEELRSAPSVRLVGGVADLAPWYRDAAVAVAPIFDGSGMKTKVAEALMFGKRIIGTPEAFAGYEPAVVASGWLCTTPDEFVAAVGRSERP